jgi:hypothetical protein
MATRERREAKKLERAQAIARRCASIDVPPPAWVRVLLQRHTEKRCAA